MRPRSLALLSGLLLSSGMPAAAGPGNQPWVDPGQVPVAKAVRSVEILRSDEPLSTRPDKASPRRGTAALGARLPLYAATRGPGCAERWLMVGPLAWVCESVVRLSRDPALQPIERPPLSDGLPHRYYFVGPDGSLGYAKLSLAEAGIPDAQLEPGFAVGIVQVAQRNAGDPFGLTTHDVWLPMRDLAPARPLTFDGAHLDGKLDVAWVNAETTPVYATPGGQRLKNQVRTRFERLALLESRTIAGSRWLRIGDGEWVKGRDVRAASTASAPEGLRAGERWIDVDIENQVLTAYEGQRPVFATLVSTGTGHGTSPQATPKGTRRIWVKLVSHDMDNLEDEEALRYYAMQAVPWVMFFDRGYGLHGTFWHRSFGNVRSHGCVNLTPRDAEWLFRWSSPRLPAGWTAALPTSTELGTLVRVR
jgi:lipoprotein-anchoring transpeptidase ErfK/SrfK